MPKKNWTLRNSESDKREKIAFKTQGQSIIWIEGISEPERAEDLEVTEDLAVFDTSQGGRAIRKERIEEIDVLGQFSHMKDMAAALSAGASIVRTKGPAGNITADKVEIHDDFVEVTIGGQKRYIRKDLVDEIEET